MSEISVSVKSTAGEIFGNLDRIDFAPIKKIVDSFRGEDLTEKERKDAVKLVKEWKTHTCKIIHDRLSVIEQFHNYQNNDQQCFLLPHYVYNSGFYDVAMTVDILDLVERLTFELGLSIEWTETKNAIENIQSQFTEALFPSYPNSEAATMLLFRQGEVKRTRLLRQALKIELSFKEKFFSHESIADLVKIIHNARKNLKKYEGKIDNLASIAEIAITTTDSSKRQTLINMYNTLTK